MKLPKCEVCGRPAAKGSIIDDFYYRHLCNNCYAKLTKMESPSSGEAVYNRGRDAEEHEADGRQPYTNGKPDAEFIHLYPERAKQLFSPEQIDQAERS